MLGSAQVRACFAEKTVLCGKGSGLGVAVCAWAKCLRVEFAEKTVLCEISLFLGSGRSAPDAEKIVVRASPIGLSRLMRPFSRPKKPSENAVEIRSRRVLFPAPRCGGKQI